MWERDQNPIESEPVDSPVAPEYGEEPRASLEEEAVQLRNQLRERKWASGKAFPWWRKVLYLVGFLSCVGAAVTLLSWPEERRQLAEYIAVNWMKLSQGDASELIQLPPPPPKETMPVFHVPASGSPAASAPEGVLYRDVMPDGRAVEPPEKVAEEASAGGFVPPPKSEASQQAYDLLLKQSEPAGQLVAGGLEAFEYREWTLVREAPPVFYIDLLARRKADGQEVHLTWEVNVSNQNVRPLSQAARDLVR